MSGNPLNITRQKQNELIDRLLRNARIAYSPFQAQVLKILFETGEPILGKQIAGVVEDQYERRGGWTSTARVSTTIARLRERMGRYFAEQGKDLEYRVEIGRTSDGYQLEFHRNQPALPPLRVFLCHSKRDKVAVRDLHARLSAEGVAPWLDHEDILPGQDWESEIRKAVRLSEVVLVCLSTTAVTKQGFVHKEIKMALDFADEKPEESIYIIPLRLEECTVPERLRRLQWVDLFEEDGYARLVKALRSLASRAVTA